MAKRFSGARMHYAVQFKLFVKDGIIQDDSDIWMGSLYRSTQTLFDKIPLSEWFSYKPIPVITGENTKDPALLGLTGSD